MKQYEIQEILGNTEDETIVCHTTEPLEKKVNNMKSNIFLQGLGDVFALALHKTYGYPIYCITDATHENIPIHYYCKPRYPIGTYADIRGITVNKKEFTKPFEWLIEDTSYTKQINPDTIQRRIQVDQLDGLYEKALIIIQNNPSKYDNKKL